ncbi:MAG: GNAT family N-acetyltransferase [Thermoplasmata archaeon]
MSKKDTAYEFLSKYKLRNSYLIARLENGDIYLDDLEDPKGILIKNGDYISMRGSEDVLLELLRDIPDGKYHFHSIDPKSFKIARKYVDEIDDNPTWMLYRPKESFSSPKNEVDELNIDDVPIINEHWGARDSDSSEYIERRIKEGPGYCVRKDDELVGWVLTHYTTDSVMCLGFLHVKEVWRRHGFAKDLTEAICQDAEKKDLTPVVDIFQDNAASLSLSKSLGFKKIGENHWFEGTISK